MQQFEPKPFGKYFLTDRIAVGGMAEIYKAKTFGVDGFEKILAIKKILSHYSADKDFITMLTDEAKLVVNLSHANIVQVYDLGRVGSDYFISMEFIDGINLRDLIERSKELREPIPPEICAYIAAEVCKGLDYAHNKKDPSGKPLKIVHRDVSPQNILVSFEGGIKIVDFGIAKAAMNLSQTNIGILKGKVTYMAPEQAFGKPIDNRTDVFSAGIVLYELFTSKRLFNGESQMEVLKKIRNTKITKESLDGLIPEPVKAILTKSLAYSVKDRYQSAADMQIDLTRVLYSNYHDFSPRHLSDLLHRWFQKELQDKKNTASVDAALKNANETVLVTSMPSEVNLVHREDRQTNSTNPSHSFDDTMKPEDAFTKNSLAHDPLDKPVELGENTEKSEITSDDEIPLEELLRRKRQKGKRLRVGVLLVLFIIVAGYVGILRYKNHVSEIKETQKNIQNQILHVVETPKKLEMRQVLLVSDPLGAKISLNDKILDQLTPVALPALEVGQTYNIKLSKEGYADLQKTILITSDINDSLSVTLTSLTPTTFNFSVTSTPPGAQIFIDGVDSQKVTPAKMSSLDPNKNYTVLLKLEHYKAYEYKLKSVDGHDQSLDVRLAIEKVIEKVTVPAQIDVPVAPVEQTVQKIPDPSTSILAVQKNAMLSVSANITGAEVFANNKLIGVAPLQKQLAPGRYRIVIKKRDYISQSKTISVAADGVEQKLYFQLQVSDETITDTKIKTNLPESVVLKKVPSGDEITNFSSTGNLRVDSNPRGASVKIDGVNRGVTPIVVSGLPKNKSMQVSISKNGYKNWQSSVKLVKDKTEVNANLVQ